MHTQEPQAYTYIPPKQEVKKLPILISVPHCGTAIPAFLKSQLTEKAWKETEDTDWFVEKIYSFASKSGIGMIHGNYSRYLVDINRPMEDTSLYQDGRLITGLFPTQSFQKEKLYLKEREIHNEEKEKRLCLYYKPYHEELTKRLEELKKEFSQVLLWEGHSIKRFVPTLHPKPFQDLILGDGNTTTAKKSIITTCMEILEKSSYSIAHNHPFQGGYITRHYGNPDQGIHAIQLEISQDIYMKEERKEIIPESFSSLQSLLLQLLKILEKNLGE